MKENVKSEILSRINGLEKEQSNARDRNRYLPDIEKEKNNLAQILNELDAKDNSLDKEERSTLDQLKEMNGNLGRLELNWDLEKQEANLILERNELEIENKKYLKKLKFRLKKQNKN